MFEKRKERYCDRGNSDIILILPVEDDELDTLSGTLACLLNQTFVINRIIIYVNKGRVRACRKAISWKNKVFAPTEIVELDEYNLRCAAYRKALLNYRHYKIILAIPGIHYDERFVERLVSVHKRYPHAVVAYRAKKVIVTELEKEPRLEILRETKYIPRRPSMDLIPLIDGGVLFPPFIEERLRQPFSEQCKSGESPSFDDVWLYAALLRANIAVVEVDWRLVDKPLKGIDASLRHFDVDGYEESLSELDGIFAAWGSGIPVESIKCYRSELGNVLLMAGQADLCGATLSLFALYKHLLAMGENVFFVIPCHGPIEDMLRAEDLDYWCLDIGAYQWVSPLSFSDEDEQERIREWVPFLQEGTKELVQFMLENRIDLVHENTSGSFMAAEAARQLEKHLVWHLREFNEEDHGQRLWKSFSPYERFGEADACVCISRAIYDKYHKLIVPNTSLHLIYNGLDPGTYYAAGHRLFSEERITVACAGRICEGKGQKDLLGAFASLADGSARWRLLFAGALHDEAYVASMKSMISEQNLEDSVEFLGVVEDMASVWAATDIAVVPSRFEAFGRCAVEAMMAGCLVVGNNTAGTAEIITDGVTGYLYSANDVEDLASCLRRAVGNLEQSRNIASNGQKEALNKFTSEENARSVFKLHQAILQKSQLE